MSPNPADSGYIEVPERIAEFRQKHPDGSLQADVIKWPDNGFGFIVVRARCFRAPDDPRPGVGWAQEPFPGKTPFTKDSELQNAETSAWGRAIVAALAADTKRGIASKEEIEARRQDHQAQTSPRRAQAKREAATRTTPPSEGQVSGVAVAPVGETAGSSQEKAAPEMSGGGVDESMASPAFSPPDSPSPGGDAVESSPASSPGDSPDLSAPANPEQIKRIKELYGGLRSATKTAFDEHKVGKLTDLTQGQAVEMILAKVKG